MKSKFKALMDSHRLKADKIPKGWRRVSEICKDEGRSGGYVREVLRAAVASKRCPPPRSYRVRREDGFVNHVLFYKI